MKIYIGDDLVISKLTLLSEQGSEEALSLLSFIRDNGPLWRGGIQGLLMDIEEGEAGWNPLLTKSVRALVRARWWMRAPTASEVADAASRESNRVASVRAREAAAAAEDADRAALADELRQAMSLAERTEGHHLHSGYEGTDGNWVEGRISTLRSGGVDIRIDDVDQRDVQRRIDSMSVESIKKFIGGMETL